VSGIIGGSWAGDAMRVLPSQQIRALIAAGAVRATMPLAEVQIQPASLDLRLGERGYALRASFLPGPAQRVEERLARARLVIDELDMRRPLVLAPGQVYLFELAESLALPADISARANPRSTTGRADLFARLVCDRSSTFEDVPAGYHGALFVELVPRTFAIRLSRGTRVNQLRFMWHQRPAAVRRSYLSVDLTPEPGTRIIGYRARHGAPVLDFDGTACHDRFDYWDPVVVGELGSLVLHPDDFYILRSCERVCLDAQTAAELLPYESAFGEFRVHYAGFLDPGFGYADADGGTPVVLEVRARDVPFLIEARQVMGQVVHYTLDVPADTLYGSAIGSAYQRQGIALGRQFRPLTTAER
jgi:dCTP deaminase